MNSNIGRFMLESLDLYQKYVSMLLQFDRIFSKLLNYTIALPVTIYHPRIPIRSFLASAQLRDVIFYYLAKGCRKVRKWSNVKKNVLKLESSTTSKTDLHLLRQKVCQRISVILENWHFNS